MIGLEGKTVEETLTDAMIEDAGAEPTNVTYVIDDATNDVVGVIVE